MSAHPSLITVCKTLINSLFPQNHSRFLSISDGTLFAPISDVSQRFRSIRITTIDASGPIVHLHLDLPRQTILFIRTSFRSPRDRFLVVFVLTAKVTVLEMSLHSARQQSTLLLASWFLNYLYRALIKWTYCM